MKFHGLSHEQALEALRVYRERFSTIGLYENRMLEILKTEGYRLAVASSKPEEFVIKILKHFDLLSFFDEVVGASMDEKRSEKKDVIFEALHRTGLKPGDRSVVMIGDRKHDVEGARICGLDSIGIYTGFAPEGELEEAGATYVFRSIQDLTAFLVRCRQ